jgi:DNA-binding CsgD family transcriptional regulator
MAFSVEEIYEGLLDDEAFARLPELLARIAHARGAAMSWRHRDGDYEAMAYSYFSKEIMDLLPEVLPIDPWSKSMLHRPNELVRLDQVVPPTAFENSPAAKKLFFDNGDDTAQCMGVIVSSNRGEGIIGVYRGRTQATFDADDQARMATGIRHFQRVLAVRGELASARHESTHAQALIDSLSIAILSVKADLTIITANAAAEAVLLRLDGLMTRGRALSAVSPAVRTRLAEAVARATGAGGREASALRVERDDDNGSYLLTVAPVIDDRGGATALITFRDPDGADPTLIDRLRALFNLTAAEAAIAVALGRGRSAEDIRRARGVSDNTLRAQLKSLMSKMNCSRQAEVASVVAALPQIRS